MKAAVISEQDMVPRYTDFPDPIAQQNDEVLLTMKAASIKLLDRSRASGQHYSTNHTAVIGVDGVGLLPNGKRVYAVGNGMIAEKAVVDKDRMVPVPDDLDDLTAAALPNAIFGSAMALKFRAAMKKGETVLINGATGFTGKMAVQIAKLYGAGKIIATGRNEKSLEELKTLGADETVALKDIGTIKNLMPIDIIIDYLWGPSAEQLLSMLKGTGTFTHRTRFVSIGSVTGDTIQLSAQILRSVDLQLSGSGLGSWTREEVKQLLKDILPEAFRLAAKKKLVVDTVSVPLKDIEQCWNMDITDGKRVVVTI